MYKNSFRFLIILSFFLGLVQIENVGAKVTQAQYLSPLPGSNYNPAGSTIAIRYGDELLKSSINDQLFLVSGSISGNHSGKVVLADDRKTVIFKPDQLFSPGELIEVNISSGIKSVSNKVNDGVTYTFTISKLDQNSFDFSSIFEKEFVDFHYLKNDDLISTKGEGVYKTAPPDFPNIQVTTPANGVADGYIFSSNFSPSAFPGDPNPGSYLLILDNRGEPVYYQKNPETVFAADFKVLENGLLAYWQGNAYHLLDDSYTEIRKILPGNGYSRVDVHELILLPNGNYMFLIYERQSVDMSLVVPGGNPNAFVTETIIQEIDSSDNVIFQWNSLDHIPVTDSNRSLTTEVIDYIHSNAIELDYDDNLLLSARHTDEIIKINHKTGDVIWRLGGKANQFSISKGPGIDDIELFYMQHDIRRLANGNISLFDNHNNQINLPSRVLEYSLDEENKTAEMVWVYKNSPFLYSSFMGNAQQLPNGNFMIGWGGTSNPNLTEIKTDGTKIFELGFDTPYINYRAYRFSWKGYPEWNPDLVLQGDADSISLFFSWNGATEISKYKIYGGNLGEPYNLIAETPKSGFETTIDLVGIQTDYCYYQVMPVSNLGLPTQFSNVVINPNCNFIFIPYIVNIQ